MSAYAQKAYERHMQFSTSHINLLPILLQVLAVWSAMGVDLHGSDPTVCWHPASP